MVNLLTQQKKLNPDLLLEEYLEDGWNKEALKSQSRNRR